MRIGLWCLFVFLFYVKEGKSQLYGIKKTPIINFINQCNQGIIDIVNFPSGDPELFIMEPTFKKFKPKLIKTPDDFYMVADGSGLVYKCVLDQGDSLYFKRIDSTVYFGYNFGSVKFNYKNKIYSFGGYGFWNLNGYLLSFEEGFDWQFIPISNNFPVSCPIYYYDQSLGLLYYLRHQNINSSRNESYEDRKVFVLNMSSKVNLELGVPYQEYTLNDIYFAYLNMPYLEGTLLLGHAKILLYNFKKNKVFELKDELLLNQFRHKITNVPNKGLIFSIGDKIYFNSKQDGSLDSLALDLSKFNELNTQLYQPITDKAGSSFLIWIISFSCIFCVWVYFRFYKRPISKFEKNTEDIAMVSTKISSAELVAFEKEGYKFSELEIQLIQIFKGNEGANRDLRVDEINECLGLKRKTLEIQKKIRTEAIHRINFKFRKLTEKDEDLIIRLRSKEDKRFTVYRISEDRMDTIEKFLK